MSMMKKLVNKQRFMDISPIKSFPIILLLVGLCEALIMVVFWSFSATEIIRIVWDPILLSLLAGPILYKVFINPLKESEKRYRAVIEHAGDGFELLDENGMFLDVNEETCRQLGYTREELLGMSIPDIDPLVSLEQYLSMFESLLHKGTPITFESKHEHKDGTTFPVEITVRVVLLGNAYRAISQARDISERIKTEEVLKRSEHFLLVSQRVANIGSYIFDVAKGSWTSTKVLDDIFGIGKDYQRSVEGWLQLIHPDQREEMEEYFINEVITKKQLFNKEYRIISINSGEIKWVQGLGELDFDEDGNPAIMIGTIKDITAHKKAEETLRKSEERYREFVEGTDDLITRVDGKGILIYVNYKALDIFGLPPQECLGRSAFDFLHPDDREQTTERFNKYLSQKATLGVFENRMVSNSGQCRNLIWNSTFHYDSNGKVTYVNGIAHDITKRKQGEEKIRETQILLQSSIESPKDMIILSIDREYRYLYFNKYHQDTMVGAYGKHVKIGMNILDCITDEGDRNNAKVSYDRALGGDGHSIIQEYGDLERYYYEIRYNPILNDKEEVIGATAFATNITDRINTETALREALSQLQTSIDNMPNVYILWDTEFRVMEWNKEAERVFGFTREDMLGKKAADFIVPEEERQLVIEQLKKLEVGEVADYSEKDNNLHKDGTLISCQWNNTPLADNEGKIFGILSMAMDITEQTKLKDRSDYLENQLRQAQKMEALGTLAGGIAHDFNNILSIISGNAQFGLAQGDDANDIDKSCFDQINKASNRARDLTKQILAFARKSKQEKVPVKLNLIINETVKMLRATLPTTIEIKRCLNCEALVNGDPTQLHQVMMNLSTNAAHAMRMEGGVLGITLNEIEIDAEKEKLQLVLETGCYLQLTISDTGTGIQKEHLDRIFDPFFTTKEKGEGTGMGLSVVHGIVKEHKGTIMVESIPGEGTAFDVFFPKLDVELEQIEAKEIDIAKGVERILYVDDEAGILNIGKKILEKYGYQVNTRSNSRNALRLFTSSPQDFDLIITDQTMPKLSGAELAIEILKIRPDIPIILCTGYSEALSREDAKKIGINTFLFKPLDWIHVAKKIRDIFDKKED